MSALQSTDVAGLEALLRGDKPVLIDFWAPWCAPCLGLMPVIEEIASTYVDSLAVVKINIADHPDLAGAMEVVGIPNLQCFKDGKRVGMRAGAASKEDIEAWLKEVLGAL